jgi:uncharacterized protein
MSLRPPLPTIVALAAVASTGANAAPPSPCVRNCCLDDADVCLGCGRKLEEILEWHQASGERRWEILAAAALRSEARLRRSRLSG